MYNATNCFKFHFTYPDVKCWNFIIWGKYLNTWRMSFPHSFIISMWWLIGYLMPVYSQRMISCYNTHGLVIAQDPKTNIMLALIFCSFVYGKCYNIWFLSSWTGLHLIQCLHCIKLYLAWYELKATLALYGTLVVILLRLSTANLIWIILNGSNLKLFVHVCIFIWQQY